MTSPAILRYAAFTDTPEGGNPAGVVLDASSLSAEPDAGDRRRARLLARPRSRRTREDGDYDVRYFSPAGRGAVLRPRDDRHRRRARRARRPRPLSFHTQAGRGPGRDQRRQRRGHGDADERGAARRGRPARSARRTRSTALRWSADDLDPALPPRVVLRRRPPPDPRRRRRASAWPTSTTTSRRSSRRCSPTT